MISIDAVSDGDQKVIVLHLSDLHFAKNRRFKAAPDELARMLVRSLRSGVKTWEPLSVVIVTGDLVETAAPREYDLALEFMGQLATELEVPRQQFIFIPGNHDVYWTRCRLAEEERYLTDEAMIRERIDAVKFSSFADFQERFHRDGGGTDRCRGRSLDGTVYPRIYDFPEFKLSVAALNSCEKESHRPQDHVGSLSRQQAQRLMDEWRHERYAGQLKIVAVHHNPDTVKITAGRTADEIKALAKDGLTEDNVLRYATDLVGFEGVDFLRAIVQETSPQLLLHGHRHESQEKTWPWKSRGMAHILSAGSLGSAELVADEKNAARWIVLDPGVREIHAISFEFDPRARLADSVESGAFRPAVEGYYQNLDLPADFPHRYTPRHIRWEPDASELSILEAGPRQILARASGELARFISAIANDVAHRGTPGYILVAESGDARQVDEMIDQALETVIPRPPLRVGKYKDGTVVRVESRADPTAVTADGVAYIRDEGNIRPASANELVRRTAEGPLPFDLQPMPGTNLEDLNMDTLRRQYDGVRALARDPDHFLDFDAWTLRENLVARLHGVTVPTHAGILLYGCSPQDHIRCAEVEFVRYSGSAADAEVQSQRTIRGTLAEQLLEVQEILTANLNQIPAQRGSMMQAVYVPEYPLPALIELARNMLQHRKYDQTHAPARIEWYYGKVVFNNPGGPYRQAAEGEFGTHSDYRNIAITRGLKLQGFTEKFGRGVRKARELLLANGNPPLEIDKDGFTTVTVRRRS